MKQKRNEQRRNEKILNCQQNISGIKNTARCAFDEL